jgi:L-galactono-1,5-lactonase
MKIVDAHMHIWSRAPEWRGISTPEKAYGKVVIEGREFPMLPPSFVDSTSPPDVALAYMDRYGVEKGVLVQEVIEGFMNEVVADAVATEPDRFVGEALMDPRREESVAELRQYLDDGLLGGMKLPVGSLRMLSPSFDIDSAICEKWLDLCAQHDAFVTIHPLKPDQFADKMHRAAERFSDVRFVIAHMGMPAQRNWPRVLELCRLPNVFMELSAVPYTFRESYPCPQSQFALQLAVREVGAEKLVWGSDYPRTLTELTYLQMIDWVRNHAGLGDDEKEKILGRNALRVFWKEGQ